MLLGVCLGCASEWTSVGSMLHEGRINDLAATQKYHSHPAPDYATCYLDRTATLPPLARGATVNVRGFFVEYAAAAGHVEAVLDRCSVEIPK
jgi:hypothetical protein